MTLAIWGTEKDVRFGYQGDGSVDRPTVTALPTGGYVVGWRENQKLKFKVYDGFGNPKLNSGNQEIVYTVDDAPGTQNALRIHPVGQDGSFAVIWNFGTTGSGLGQKVRVFNADGVGGTTATLTTAAGDASYIGSMAPGPNGGFVSTYKDGASLKFSIHSASGSVVESIWLSTIPNDTANYKYPKVAQIAPGKYIVSYTKGGNSPSVYYRIVNLNAVERVSAEVDTLSGDRPEVVALKNDDGNPNQSDDFAVIKQVGGSGKGVDVQFHGLATNPITVRVTEAGNGDGDFMSATALRGGRVAVVLSGEAPPNNADYKIVLKIVGPTGGLNGQPLVNSIILEAKKGLTPTITELKDGRLSVAWWDTTVSQSLISNVIVDPRLKAVNVYGTNSKDTYVGSEYDGDRLYGYGGNDTLDGGAGDDILFGDRGADRLIGGTNNADGDWADYTSSIDEGGVTADLSKGGSSGDAKGDTYSGIENLRGSDDETLKDVLTGDARANRLEGLQGNDTLNGAAGNDTIDGGKGSDRIYGGAGADSINGGIDSGLNDWDDVSYQTATAAIRLVLADTTGGSNGGDALGDRFERIDAYVGSRFNDTMTGTTGWDTFYGDAGNDLLQGGTADDSTDYLNGQAGNDTLEGGGGGQLIGGEGFDYASYANAVEREGRLGVTAALDGNISNLGDEADGDTYTDIEGLIGSNYKDYLRGNTLNNVLLGGGEADHLYGLAGDDTLNGGAGGNSLYGDVGFDMASYANANQGITADLNNKIVLNDLVSGSAVVAGTGEAAGDRYSEIEGLIGSAHADRLIG